MKKLKNKDTIISLLREIRDSLKSTHKPVESTQNEINFPALKRPTLKEIQADRSYVKSIEKDESTEEAVTMKIVSVLKEGETSIRGSEYKSRLEPLRGKLGFQHLQWLIANQDEFPWLFKQATDEKWWYLIFPGLIVVDGDGHRGVPCADQDDKRWRGFWSWRTYDFLRFGRVAVSSK